MTWEITFATLGDFYLKCYYFYYARATPMIVLSKERITKAVITTKSGFLTPHRKRLGLTISVKRA